MSLGQVRERTKVLTTYYLPVTYTYYGLLLQVRNHRPKFGRFCLRGNPLVLRPLMLGGQTLQQLTCHHAGGFLLKRLQLTPKMSFQLLQGQGCC